MDVGRIRGCGAQGTQNGWDLNSGGERGKCRGKGSFAPASVVINRNPVVVHYTRMWRKGVLSPCCGCDAVLSRGCLVGCAAPMVNMVNTPGWTKFHQHRATKERVGLWRSRLPADPIGTE